MKFTAPLCVLACGFAAHSAGFAGNSSVVRDNTMEIPVPHNPAGADRTIHQPCEITINFAEQGPTIVERSYWADQPGGEDVVRACGAPINTYALPK